MTTSEDADVCARCAVRGSTCCRLTPGQEELCFPVSEIERQRIIEAAPGVGGLTGAANTRTFLAHMTRLFPRDRRRMAELFPLGGQHLRLATRLDGSCLFLGPEGCALPREVRPYYCRLFPFWVSAGAVAAFEASCCLAAQESGAVKPLLRQLRMTPGMVLELHGRMRMAWGLPPGEDGISPGKHRDKVG